MYSVRDNFSERSDEKLDETYSIAVQYPSRRRTRGEYRSCLAVGRTNAESSRRYRVDATDRVSPDARRIVRRCRANVSGGRNRRVARLRRCTSNYGRVLAPRDTIGRKRIANSRNVMRCSSACSHDSHSGHTPGPGMALERIGRSPRRHLRLRAVWTPRGAYRFHRRHTVRSARLIRHQSLPYMNFTSHRHISSPVTSVEEKRYI